MKHGKVLSRSSIKRKVKDATSGKWVGSGRAKYAGYGDLKYYLPTEDEIAEFLRALTYPNFQDEVFDCEDFAFVCKGHVAHFQSVPSNVPDAVALCVGIAWGRFSWIGRGRQDHACNWVMTNTGKFNWFEPQTNEFHAASKVTKKSLRLILI